MANTTKFALALITVLAIYILFGMYRNGGPMLFNSQTVLTNEPIDTKQSEVRQPHVFPQNPMPTLPTQVPQGGMQVIRSLLGLEVKFLNGTVNYPGAFIVNDPRFQALGSQERLVDSIKVQPFQGAPFLLLIAIGKSADGLPLVVPGKFDVLRKTQNEGFVLRDSHGRAFYYSGYVMATQLWQTLPPGQVLQDKFCKQPVIISACSPKDTVTVLLKKPMDPRKDIPFLGLVK